MAMAMALDHLPLTLWRTDYITPAPSTFGSGFANTTIDWIPEFCGHAWVAYGASSLLVISHLPSPLSKDQSSIGPLFRQVFELPHSIAAVSCSSDGHVAAASADCIFLFSPLAAPSLGSFCWSQNAVLLHSSTVEALHWTASHDGILSAGDDVVLWKRRETSWEVACKFKPNHSQNLLSASWSVDGPSATASTSSMPGNPVYVWQGDGKAECAMAELRHPCPILSIQWRPSAGRPLQRKRHLLLTNSLDGAVRLWAEIDHGRSRKSETKVTPHSFCVVALIDTNKNLGKDLSVMWATEITGLFKYPEGATEMFATDDYEQEKAGHCEWIIGFGTEMKISFWAIHCLDEYSPLRYPRVTLWKTKELQGLQLEGDQLPLRKVYISRNNSSAPPDLCSFLHFSVCKLTWSCLYTQTLNNISTIPEERSLTASISSVLSTDGHSAKILHFALHPYHHAYGLAASLDSDGILLFWLSSTTSNAISGLPILTPMWKLSSKVATCASAYECTSLTWAPYAMDDGWILMLGHSDGVDCFIVKSPEAETQKVEFQKFCTIPFCGQDLPVHGPSNIYSIPLHSSCNDTFSSIRFMLLGVWIAGFRAVSWEIVMHCCDSSGSYDECESGTTYNAKSSLWKFESISDSKRYNVFANPCSSQFPDPYNHDQVTSFSVVQPGGLFPFIPQDQTRAFDTCNNYPAYVLATGSGDGTLKLWRSERAEVSSNPITWGLVGLLSTKQGPIGKISMADCGQKIATICTSGNNNAESTLQIWETVNVVGTGCFLLEDVISLKGEVVAIKWLSLGNGQQLLGVCIKDKLHVYAQRRFGGQTLPKSGESASVWCCIACTHISAPVFDLIWGPRATAMAIHEDYIGLYSQWLFLADAGNQDSIDEQNYLNSLGMTNEEITSTTKEVSNGANNKPISTTTIFLNNCSDLVINNMTAERALLKTGLPIVHHHWDMIEVVEELSGPLQVYHPKSLLSNIYLGDWKRAYRGLQHLTAHLCFLADGRSNCPTKSHPVFPQMDLSSYLEGVQSQNSDVKDYEWNRSSSSNEPAFQFQIGLTRLPWESESNAFNDLYGAPLSKFELKSLVDFLKKPCELPAIADEEKNEIFAIIDLLHEVSDSKSASVYESLDLPGRRFWVAMRYQQLHFLQRFGRVASAEDLAIDSTTICWAFHSDCQEILLNSILPSESSWPEMRAMGVGFWFTNSTQLRSRMEKLARLQYLKKKDPKDCALLYIALQRLQVLAGLFKISKDEKDRPLVGFLSRNFQEEKNKAAALKNAYILLGRHQLELAIAFFLLGGDASSAINVCAKNLKDEQLALVICRLIEGSGGQLEHQLTTKLLLPSAIEKGDFWLTSLLEWQLGNYSQSFLSMFGFQCSSVMHDCTLQSNQVPFLDPSIGLYCLGLSAKNCMRNAVGEYAASLFGRWASLIRATALRRCGLPIDALECCSSSLSSTGGPDQETPTANGPSEVLSILKPSPIKSSNWLLDSVAVYLENHDKLDLALQHLSQICREHPCWPDSSIGSCRLASFSGQWGSHEYDEQLGKLRNRLHNGLALVEQRFSLDAESIFSMIMVLLSNYGCLHIGYDLLKEYRIPERSPDKTDLLDRFHLYLLLNKLPVMMEDVLILLSRFVAVCSMMCSPQCLSNTMNTGCSEVRFRCTIEWENHINNLRDLVEKVRSILKLSSNSFTERLLTIPFVILDLYEYCACFASLWSQRNSKALILMLQPLLVSFSNGHAPYEVDIADMKGALHQIYMMFPRAVVDGVGSSQDTNGRMNSKNEGDMFCLISEDERWQILGTSLWQHIFRLIDHKLDSIFCQKEQRQTSSALFSRFSSSANSVNFEAKDENIEEQIALLSGTLAQLLQSTISHVSYSHVKQLGALMRQKLSDGLPAMTLIWLEEYSRSHSGALHDHWMKGNITIDTMNSDDKLMVDEKLWDIWADPKIVSESFEQEKINWYKYINRKPCSGWKDIYDIILTEGKDYNSNECNYTMDSTGTEAGPPLRGLFPNTHTFLSSWRKEDTFSKETMLFQSPKDICKRNGELLEAICINSTDEQQFVVSSNRKGILFVNYEEGFPSRCKAEYTWAEADWPKNSWTTSERVSVLSCLSDDAVLGTKKGRSIAFDGSATGMASSATPGRDFTGGGAFGIPGYAGIGASGLGWENEEELEELVQQPVAIENIRARSLSSHPSMPYFLVGSTNALIYLWEFGKDKAIATYGVLPVVKSPPPYALASVSALQFDHCGHRFATAASDGIISTWQLEVEGRGNVHPTESSLCFNNYASDIRYVTSSGSIIVAAGCSSNNVNVVIWDTLAPTSTSRASIVCHEGGARSLSVFDNDLGSSYASPLILTGGKGGDVGLHDFRYIATGRSKRLKNSDNSEQSPHATSTTDKQAGSGTKVGVENFNGMLWYIPKAHLGSVTKISTIPNTSLFLTGSKDGDLKLWDAKNAKLVYQWSKLHERHTFVQPSTRGFGGVTRAGVTDIQVVSHGFVTCGGDGSAKLLKLRDNRGGMFRF